VIRLFDSSRNRIVPVAIYQPRKENPKTRVIIFNHGYDGNKNDKSNRSYSYLTRFFWGKRILCDKYPTRIVR
jgi:cephalosporin-C deacetylase-like acetyl esterase